MFSHNFKFFHFSRFFIDITVYQYRKNVLYFFYNVAQRTLTEEWREIFCVDIELYQHALASTCRLQLKPSIRSQLHMCRQKHTCFSTWNRGSWEGNEQRFHMYQPNLYSRHFLHMTLKCLTGHAINLSILGDWSHELPLV